MAYNPVNYNKKKRLMSFDPEGSGYDMDSAVGAGMKMDPATKHWSSRVPKGPNEGMLLKGRNHKTWNLLEEGEKQAGYEVYKENGRYRSRKAKKPHQIKIDSLRGLD